MSSSEDEDCIWLEANPEKTSFIAKTIIIDGISQSDKFSDQDNSFNHEINNLFAKKLNLDPLFIYKQNLLLKGMPGDVNEDEMLKNETKQNTLSNGKENKPKQNVKQTNQMPTNKEMPKKYELFFEKKTLPRRNEEGKEFYCRQDHVSQNKQRPKLPREKFQPNYHPQKNEKGKKQNLSYNPLSSYQSDKNKDEKGKKQNLSYNLLSSYQSDKNKDFSKMDGIPHQTDRAASNKRSSIRDETAGPSHSHTKPSKKHYKKKH